MHEYIYTRRIINEAKKQGKVKKIIVKVGDLSPISAEDLEKCFKEKTNWLIETVKEEAVVECDCGFKGNPKIIERHHDFVLFECPECGEIPKVLKGKDIILREVVVE